MERKKLIRIVLIALALMIGLIIFENTIRGTKNLVSDIKEKREEEERKEAYEQTDEYKKEVELNNNFSEISKLLEEKNVDKLYELLDENYKDYRFENNKEKFEEYMQKYMTADAKLTLQDYEKSGNTYRCRVLRENASGEYTSFAMSIIMTNSEPKYQLLFDNIVTLEKTNIKLSGNGIECNILYKATSNGVLNYNIEYKNVGKTDISFECLSIVVSDEHSGQYTAQNQQETITLKPGETKRQNAVFIKDDVNMFKKKHIVIQLKDSNQEIIELSKYI